MEHKDHLRLLCRGVPGAGVWGELGSGQGAFTLALGDLLGEGGSIHAVDRDSSALQHLEKRFAHQCPQVRLRTYTADFTRPMPFMPSLDGILLANSLHFVREKGRLLQELRRLLEHGGRVLIVEYDTDRGNHWVPYPFSFAAWEVMAREAGFQKTELLGKHPSSFLGQFYAACSQ